MQALDIPYAFPVGISFFTFRSLSYTLDVYRGEIPVERNLIRYAVFVSLFPQLAAGPIDRARSLIPQLHGTLPIARQDVTDGLSHFLVGFFKKAALADALGLYVDKVYGNPDQFQAPALLMATFAFSWQIYFDFSGYTDMARGVARMMGFRLALNFNNPYAATGLGEFWGRWHISLSTWFRDYVYIPLGGNRGTKLGTYRNMILTMVISGVWHGPAWGFILWGALHALGRVVTRELERTAFYRDRVPRFVKQIGTFAFVTFAWIFFRGQSWEKSWLILSGIFTSGWADPQFPILMLLMILAAWAYQFLHEGGPKIRALLELTPVRLGLAAAMLVYLMVFAQGAQRFIYQQF
jgi:D-alanyl-lipoteichoic acid acyltransferase DltB (MBOAT superfamily)